MEPTTVHVKPRRLHRIVVGTDFSSNATAALEWAIDVARPHNAEVTIVHALEAVATASVPLAMQQELSRSLSIVEGIVRQASVPVTSRYRRGRPWEVIAETADDLGADLIVVGARGQGAYARLLLGSTADRVVRTAAVPVLTVHPTDSRRPVHTVLAGIDFSDESKLAAHAAADLLSGLTDEGRLVLLHAWQPLVEYGFGTADGQITVNRLDDSEDQAVQALEQLGETFRSDRLQVETVVRQGYPASVIHREAEAIGADLIAVGTHGRSGLRHLMMGSIAERVLHHATRPVLSVREPPPARDLAPAGETAASAIR